MTDSRLAKHVVDLSARYKFPLRWEDGDLLDAENRVVVWGKEDCDDHDDLSEAFGWTVAEILNALVREPAVPAASLPEQLHARIALELSNYAKDADFIGSGLALTEEDAWIALNEAFRYFNLPVPDHASLPVGEPERKSVMEFLTHRTCGTVVETAQLYNDVAIYIWCPKCRDLVEVGELDGGSDGHHLVMGTQPRADGPTEAESHDIHYDHQRQLELAAAVGEPEGEITVRVGDVFRINGEPFTITPSGELKNAKPMLAAEGRLSQTPKDTK